MIINLSISKQILKNLLLIGLNIYSDSHENESISNNGES